MEPSPEALVFGELVSVAREAARRRGAEPPVDLVLGGEAAREPERRQDRRREGDLIAFQYLI